ncbi:MAG: peptidoglycan D,D-transpeptidase FtsI family protein [Gaiellaceae bacterium]
MNKQISRVALVALLLLAALIVGTTYWQVWAAPGLAARQDNAIERVAQFRIRRGLIYASDGKTVLAANTGKKQGGETLYFRRYPTHGFASQTVGYSTQGRSRAGLELSENAYLTAANANLGTIWSKLTDKLNGTTVTGNNLVLNLRVKAQKIAETALRGNCGAAVAFNPKTGRVYVMASSPTYDPNKIESGKGYASILHSPSACPGSSSALLNRATQGLYSPGSTFKTVTAAAGLDAGVYTQDSRFYDPGYCTEYGKKVSNALNPDQTAESYGNVNFLEAYEHSINAVFCNIGKALGAKKILDEAKDFGFYSKPPLELPSDEVAASGLYNSKRALYDNPSIVDPGRLAFGQEHLLATPLQMALVAGAVANGGVIMQPQLVKKVTAPGGHTLVKFKPRKWRRAMKPKTAAILNQFMQAVVTGGTGRAAAIPGIKVAGKTGTAETGLNHVYTAWFIFFAPADNPQVAGAVVLEHQLNGFGGSVAAPIAKQLMEAILPAASNK